MQKPFIHFGLLLLLGAGLFSSCRTRNITCKDGTIQVRPVGFSKADFDSAAIIRYAQGSSFVTPVDSTRAVYYATSSYTPDTASLAAFSTDPDSVHRVFIIPGYDYRIILPKLGRSFSLTNIMQSGKTHESYTTGFIEGDKLIVCYNSVMQVMVDNNKFTGTADVPGIAVEIAK